MDIAAPSTVTFATQFGAPAPGGTPGEVVDAKVLQILADGRARLALANTLIDVVSSVPLSVGAIVRLAVRHTSDGIRLSLLDPQHVAGPKGLVPLVVDAGSRAALEAAFSTGRHAHPAASGGPGEAARVGASSISSIAQVPSPPLSPAAANAAALAQAVRGAAARQGGLAPLFADLAVAVRSPSLPQAVKVAAAELLALRVPVGAGLPAALLKQAFQRSGLFLESALADDAGAAPPADLKTALLNLRQVLRAFVAVDAGPMARPELTPSVPPRPATLSMLASATLGAPPAAVAASAHAGPVPAGPVPPPYRGAPTSGQPELPPSIALDTPADDAARALLRETEGALGRQTLLQAASLPERPHQADPTNGPRWHFEVPFATPQGTTLAQFEIARDGQAASAENAKPAWRARFSVDIEPLGAIHAQVALIGDRAAVTLWAERPEAAARIRAGTAELKAALASSDFDPDIMVRDGAPPRPRETVTPAGRFLDRAT